MQLPSSPPSARSVAANALGLGPRDRRCKSCRADHFRNGLMDEWMGGLVGSTHVRVGRINPIHSSKNPVRAAAVAEIDEAFVF